MSCLKAKEIKQDEKDQQKQEERNRMRCVISSIRRFVNLRIVLPIEAENLISKIEESMGEDNKGKLLAAVDEQVAIVKNTEKNNVGYHLNCIHSGKTVYSVVPISNEEEEIEIDEDPFALDFATEEEAKEAAKKFRHADVINFDPYEMWAVLNSDNKNELKTVYHSSLDALVALYELAKPKAFMEYLKGKPIISFSVENENEEDSDNA